MAADAAVVAKVSVVLAGPPFGFTLPGLNEQLAPVGNPLQPAPVKVMVWLNPPLGVIVIVVVPDCPGELMVTVVGLAPIVKSPEEADVTVSVSVVVCVKLPEVPITVTVVVPVVAVPLAVSVSVLVLVAGFGLKAAVTPLGKPEAENDTLPLKPFSGVIVIVLVPWLPCTTLKLFGLADSVKLGAGAGVTVTVSVVVCVKLPEVPITVTVVVPVVAVPLAVSVSVLVLVAGFGLKTAVTPLGKPEAENDTLLLKPFSGVIVIVLVPWLPCTMLKLFGLADSV